MKRRSLFFVFDAAGRFYAAFNFLENRAVFSVEFPGDFLDVERGCPLSDPSFAVLGVAGPDEFRQVDFARGAIGNARTPAEGSQRGGRFLVRRGLEVGDAKVFVAMRADEEQVLAEPRLGGGILAARGDKPAQHLAQGAGHAAASREGVGIYEFENENAPGLALIQRLKLPNRAVDQVSAEVRRPQFGLRPAE